MLKNRSKLIFSSCILLFGTLFVQMGMYLLKLLFGWDAKYNVIDLCHTALGFLGFHWIGYILNILVFHAFVFTIGYIVKQLFHSNQFYSNLMKYQHARLTHDLNRQYGNGEQSIIVIRSIVPMAFAMGLFRPRIIIY